MFFKTKNPEQTKSWYKKHLGFNTDQYAKTQRDSEEENSIRYILGMKEKIEKIFYSSIGSKQIHEAVLLVENGSGDFSVNFGYGGKTIDTLIQVGSVGKLFTTTCILILQEQKNSH